MVTWLENKRRYRRYKERTRQLPANSQAAVHALERYLNHLGGIEDGNSAADMLEHLVELFEDGAASGTPVREIVGPDPVEFADAIARHYPQDRWKRKERGRLTNAIKRAAGETSN